MWLCEEQPLPLSAAHPHPSVSHSARVGLGGEVGPLLSWGILRGACKGFDCVGLYFCGEKEGEKREKELDGESRRRVWTQPALLSSSPKE